MSRPAFLVDGNTEQLIVQDLCPGSAVRVINCNGDKVSLEAIAKRIGTLARLLQKRFSPMVIVIDREDRELSASQIKERLLCLLDCEQIDVPVMIGIADRMFENWVLADFRNCLRQLKLEERDPDCVFEGTRGAGKLKALLPEGSVYVKTIHGVAWFKSGNPEIMKQHSQSFRIFTEEIASTGCRWLSQTPLPGV